MPQDQLGLSTAQWFRLSQVATYPVSEAFRATKGYRRLTEKHLDGYESREEAGDLDDGWIYGCADTTLEDQSLDAFTVGQLKEIMVRSGMSEWYLAFR
jgi:hypothetical protein